MTTPVIRNVSDLIKAYGPFKLIYRAEERKLIKDDKANHILCVMSCDVPYADLPPDEQPSDEELKERGETKETHMGSVLYVEAGHHLVNVDEIYQSAKPMPLTLMIQGNENVWFGDNGLPSP
jgi:hypothetical protein